MGLSITIHGARGDATEDKARAHAAAMAVFNAAGCRPVEAMDEYRSQFDALDCEVGMTGLALVWLNARSAAEIAASEGWHNPLGCEVTMDAWRR
jgi:hypothetical protein